MPEVGAVDSEFAVMDPYGQGNDGGEEQWIRAGVGIIPEPASVVVWSLLGALGFGLGWWRRGRRMAVVEGTDAGLSPGRMPWSDQNRAAILEIISRGRGN